jgi:hypothetical protein
MSKPSPPPWFTDTS